LPVSPSPLSTGILKRVIRNHPRIIWHEQLIDNYYFIPGHDYSRAKRDEIEIQRWLENLQNHNESWQALQESEKRYRSLIELGTYAGEAFVMLQDIDGMEGIQTFVSDEWPRITGYPREELLGACFFSLLDIKYRQPALERHRLKIQGESFPGNYEMVVIGKDGRRTDIEVTGAYSIYRGERANVLYIRDITERRQIEERLKVYRDDLEKLVSSRTAELTREIARRKKTQEKVKKLYNLELKLRKDMEVQMEERIEFTRALVHELKTPILPLMGASQMLVENAQDATTKRIARNINRGAARLYNNINDLIGVIKGELGLLQLRLSEIDLAALLTETVDFMLPDYERKAQRLEFVCSPVLPPVRVDGERIRQVVLNLLENASRFSSAGGVTTVRCREDGDNLIVEVEDTGCGIAMKDIPRLFEPYQTVRGGEEQLSGLGLGLPLSKMIIELHGGKIWIRSGRHAGTTVSFSLPVLTDKTPVKLEMAGK
jgi:PAS domain S-box-containing protein